MASGHFFKQNVTAPTFTEGSTLLSAKYLGINATAADSSKLGGVAASGYAVLNHNHTGTYEPAFTTLGISKGGTGATTAASGAVLIGPSSGATTTPTWRRLVAGDIPDLSSTYSTTNHVHSYLPLEGGTLTGDLSFSNSSDRTISVASTGSGFTGKYLVLKAGSTAAGSANIWGGNLSIYSGQSTGDKYSSIEFFTPTPGVSGATTLNAVASRGYINHNGLVLSVPLSATTGTFSSTIASSYNNSSHGQGAYYASGSPSWYMFDLGSRSATAGRYGIGLTDSEANRTLSFHIPNYSAYSSIGNIPKFAWYSNGADSLMTLQSASGDLWTKGSITATAGVSGTTGAFSSTVTAGILLSSSAADVLLRLYRPETGTGGVGIAFDNKNAAGTQKTYGWHYVIPTDNTTGSEDADHVFYNIKAGSSSETLRVLSTGELRLKGTAVITSTRGGSFGDAIDNTGAAGTNRSYATTISGDTNYRFSINYNGLMEWGDGTNARDTNLYRAGIGQLATDYIFINNRSTATDTAYIARVNNDAAGRFALLANGQLQWGDGTNARDTVLYRSAANVLKTDDAFQAASYAIGTTEVISSTRNATLASVTGNDGTVGFLLRNSGGEAHLILDSDSVDGIGVGSDYTIIGSSGSTLLGNVNIKTGAIQIAGTAITDTSRNLINIGTIGCGAITSTGAVSGVGGTFTGLLKATDGRFQTGGYEIRRKKWGGSQDLTWKRILSVSEAATTAGEYRGLSFRGVIRNYNSNYGHTVPTEYPFFGNFYFSNAGNVIDTCSLTVPYGMPDILKIVKIGTRSYELQVRQHSDWLTMEVEWEVLAAACDTNTYHDLDAGTVGTNQAISYTYETRAGNLYANNLYAVGGKIGVGTSSPSYDIHVLSTGTNPRILLQSSANSSSAEINLVTKDSGGVEKRVHLAASSSGDLQFWTQSGGSGGSTKATLSSAGALSLSAGLTATTGIFSGLLQVTKFNDTSILALSGNAAGRTDISVGRTAAEIQLAVAGSAGHYATGAIAGDTILRTTSSSVGMFVGVAGSFTKFTNGVVDFNTHQIKFSRTSEVSPGTGNALQFKYDNESYPRIAISEYGYLNFTQGTVYTTGIKGRGHNAQAFLEVSGPIYIANNSSVRAHFTGTAPTLTAAGGSPTGWYRLNFNSEIYDSLSEWDTSTYRFTPKVWGKYLFNVCLTRSSAVGTGYRSALYLREYTSAGTLQRTVRIADQVIMGGISGSGVVMDSFASGNYWEVWIYTASDITFTTASDDNYLTIERLA